MTEAFGLAHRPVFVGGLFKSGTSLTRVLLGQHPDLFASYETYWFDPQVSEHWDDPTSKRMSYMREFYRIDDTLYGELVAAKRAAPRREFVDILLEDAAARAGKRRWVEKTPGNIAHIARIHATWKDASVVLCTRDFRDTFASWKARRGNTIEEFVAAARAAWGPLAGRMSGADPEFLAIDYADLIEDTAATMARVLEHIGEPWDARCAAIDTDGTAAERERVKEVTGRDNLTSVSLSQPIFASSLGQWRDILTADEAATIERELAPLFAVMGKRWA